MWDECGMARTKDGLLQAIEKIKALREEFWSNVLVPGSGEEFNQQLMCVDALQREESCGGHFRVEHQTPEGEALRDDDDFSYVAAWAYSGDVSRPQLRKEWLTYEEVHFSTRSYK